jgi:heptaprenyl diphosphate synthase
LASASEDITRVIAEAAVTTAEGEHNELMLSFDATVSREQHEDIMLKKTACIFSAAARVGGMLSGLDGEDIDALGTFAENLGMAFQVTDDVLDLEPSAALTGKPSGMDLKEGRMNTVIISALEMLEGKERDDVVRVFMASSPSTQDVDRALALVRGTGAGGAAMKQAQDYIDRALEALDDRFDPEVREHMTAMAAEMVRRRS